MERHAVEIQELVCEVFRWQVRGVLTFDKQSMRGCMDLVLQIRRWRLEDATPIGAKVGPHGGEIAWSGDLLSLAWSGLVFLKQQGRPRIRLALVRRVVPGLRLKLVKLLFSLRKLLFEILHLSKTAYIRPVITSASFLLTYLIEDLSQ